jgi:hypothetical protein
VLQYRRGSDESIWSASRISPLGSNIVCSCLMRTAFLQGRLNAGTPLLVKSSFTRVLHSSKFGRHRSISTGTMAAVLPGPPEITAVIEDFNKKVCTRRPFVFVFCACRG